MLARATRRRARACRRSRWLLLYKLVLSEGECSKRMVDLGTEELEELQHRLCLREAWEGGSLQSYEA
jgi:hypothetical protein